MATGVDTHTHTHTHIYTCMHIYMKVISRNLGCSCRMPGLITKHKSTITLILIKKSMVSVLIEPVAYK